MPDSTAGVRRRRSAGDTPYFVAHESFAMPGAEAAFTSRGPAPEEYADAHMPDEETRECARRMHYAAWRMDRAGSAGEREAWRRTYLTWRDRIVLGNRKLVYRAVQRWTPASTWAEEVAGDCQVVLIQAVAAYNPWLGVRFSTYAFTCLMRALARLTQRHCADRFSRSLPLETLPGGEPRDPFSEETPAARLSRVDEFLHSRNGPLSLREQTVLIRRFRLDDRAGGGTLEQLGKELGLSKERVRQVEKGALDKLRRVLGAVHLAE